jgi:hypothetical protein
MLAKARCDTIVQRTALTIPVECLTGILLCSGLPRVSVITIVERLGQTVELAHDRHDTIATLLEPITSIGWTLVNAGSKQEKSTKRNILARIAAYVRIYEISFPSANLFLSSLMEDKEARDLNKGIQPHVERIGITGSMESASTLLCEVGDYTSFSAMELKANAVMY